MIQKITFTEDLENILKKMENNCYDGMTLRKQIRELQEEQTPQVVTQAPAPTKPHFEIPKAEEVGEDDELNAYIEEYRKTSFEDMDTFIELLPDSDDYQYERIILRLQAESIREIKEIIEMMEKEDKTSRGIFEEFLKNEQKKLAKLKKLLQEEEKKEEKQTNHNTIILVPNKSGKIRIFDEIEDIPSDFYEEIYELIVSIINGKFKRRKRFNIGSNAALGSVSEVRGNKVRVLYQRLAQDVYAIYSVFLKKTSNARGYRSLLLNRVGDYKEVEESIKKNIENGEFLEANDQYVEELWNKLGHSEAAKIYRKGRKDV